MSPKKAKTRTVSEDLFEDFCAQVGIPCDRVEEEADAQRPDYELEPSGHRIVAEVKQFDPNPEEAKSIKKMKAGGVGGVSAKPGDRIRKAIGNAAPQLKALSGGVSPSMLVVYNNSGAGQHTDPYSVATAMQGFDVIDVEVPHDPSVPPEFQDPRSGPGKKMTPSDNTTISAIGVLRTNFDARTILCIYHNRHAVNPIDPDWLRHPRVMHFRRPEGAKSSLDGWVEV